VNKKELKTPLIYLRQLLLPAEHCPEPQFFCFKVVKKINKKLTQLVNQVKGHLIKRYGDKIKEIILYGSYVRGKGTKDSRYRFTCAHLLPYTL